MLTSIWGSDENQRSDSGVHELLALRLAMHLGGFIPVSKDHIYTNYPV